VLEHAEVKDSSGNAVDLDALAGSAGETPDDDDLDEE
jgi:hypothetical protein